MGFGTIVVIAFIVSVLITFTMNAVLSDSVIQMSVSGAFWIAGLIAWIVMHKRARKEREELEEELKKGPAKDM